jgi:hypothetical protein
MSFHSEAAQLLRFFNSEILLNSSHKPYFLTDLVSSSDKSNDADASDSEKMRVIEERPSIAPMWRRLPT